MKITVIAYLEPDAKDPDIVVPQVIKALEANGHETSLLTIQADVGKLITGLRRRKPDLVFNLVESFDEDIVGGLIGVTGVLDLLQVPYTGGGPGELYLQEDKSLSKKLLAYDHIPFPDYAVFAPDAGFESGGKLHMPLFVKPLRMEASQGIDAQQSLVRDTEHLLERVLNIHKSFGDSALAEEYIEGREFYVGIIGNGEDVVFPPVEMDFSNLPDDRLPVLDNRAKWDEKSAQFQGTKAVLPDLEPELRARIQGVARDAYRALRVRDYGRVDMRLTESGEIYVLEVNANCYLEEQSEFAMAARAHGIEYNQLVNRIVELAVKRSTTQSRVQKRKRRRKPSAVKN